jgi:hypothetical protein
VVQEVDQVVETGSRRGRDICEPVGIWMKPACVSDTRGERKGV